MIFQNENNRMVQQQVKNVFITQTIKMPSLYISEEPEPGTEKDVVTNNISYYQYRQNKKKFGSDKSQVSVYVWLLSLRGAQANSANNTFPKQVVLKKFSKTAGGMKAEGQRKMSTMGYDLQLAVRTTVLLESKGNVNLKHYSPLVPLMH